VGRTESKWRTIAQWIMAAAFIGLLLLALHHF
jgi:hypothetical protein